MTLDAPVPTTIDVSRFSLRVLPARSTGGNKNPRIFFHAIFRADEDDKIGVPAWRETFNTSPIPVINTSIEDPPNDMNGSGIPLVGKRPVTTPKLINTGTPNHKPTPAATNA